MEFLIIIIIAIFVCYIQLTGYFACQWAVTHFSDRFVSLIFTKLRTFIGINLREYLPLPEDLSGSPALVMFASPSCDQCHNELRKLLLYRKQERQSMPFVCFAEREDSNFDAFVQEFQEHVRFIPAEKEALLELQVSSFPSFFFLDSSGVIRYPSESIKDMISLSKDRRRMTRYLIH